MQLVQRAEDALHGKDVASAEKCMALALQTAPDDAAVLTAFGSMLADVQNEEKAVLTLRKAVRLEPDAGHEKYMCALKRSALRESSNVPALHHRHLCQGPDAAPGVERVVAVMARSTC